MKCNKYFLKKIVAVGVALFCSMGAGPIFAGSSVELVDGRRDYHDQITWDDPDHAPILRVTLEDVYKIRDEYETFEMELTNATWYEGRNTTLYITDAQGVEIYDASIYVKSDRLAQVMVKVPRDIDKNAKISIDIPLLIKVKEKVEDVSVGIKELDDENGLIQDTVIQIANTNDKIMSWKVGDIPTIGEGEAIAPIYFEETKAGSLGSREIEFVINLQNRYLRFDEPEYDSKKENADDIEYYLDVDEYIEYGGGFKDEDQILKVSITKDGKTMRVQMRGSVPTQRGTITLKNFKIKSTDKDVSKEAVVIVLQDEKLMSNNERVTVGYFDPAKGTSTAVLKPEENTEIQEQTDDNTTEVPKVPKQKVTVVFKVNANYYTVNAKNYEMDGKTYIKDPGYTMVPVRYVAEALGTKDIKVKDGEVSLNYNDKKIVFTIGSTQATVNGEVVMMQVPLELKNGRVYAPMGEVAQLLGIDKKWDSKTQSANFIK